MQLNLYLAQTLRQATKEVIKNIELSQNLDLRNFLVVPDRFSLQAEKLIFDELKISSTFNIDVVSISKLANLVLKLSGNSFQTQSNLEGVLLIFKILIEHQKELESLQNANLSIDLAKEIYLTISQLKSCEINADKFLNDAQQLNIKKAFDIAKIYQFYENERREKFDAADLLNLFESQIENSELVKNSNFYFAEFDSLTSQAKTILKLLTKSAKSVSIATSFSASSENGYIYEKDILQKVQSICEELKISPNIICCSNSLNDFQKHVADNLFAFKQQQKDIPYGVAVLNNSNISAEIEQVANIIKFEILKNNYSFNDFNIFVPNLESYQKQIKEIFKEENISYYLDANQTLTNLAPVKFLFKLIDFFEESNMLNFLAVLSDDFSKIEVDEIEIINKNIFEKGKKIKDILSLDLPSFQKFNEKLTKIQKKYEKIGIFCEFIDLLTEIKNVFDFENQVENLIDFFKASNNLSGEKVYIQFNYKFEQAIEQLKQLDFSCTLTKSDMKKIAREMFANVLVSNLPLSVNSVFVGQNDLSFFEEKKIGIFVGCSNGNVPLSIKDSGLILDNDINKFENIKIEPSVEMLNRRNKFKLFNDSCLIKEKVYLSCINNGEAMCEFVKSFKNMWRIQGEQVPISDEFYTIVSGENNLMQHLIFKSLLNSKRDEILRFIKNAKIEKTISKEQIQNAKNVLYPKNSTSISKIQQFFSCPFAHFAGYGLNLQPNEVCQVLPLDVGNLFHAFAEKFLKSDLSSMNEQELVECVNNSFEFAENSSERLKMLSRLIENRGYFSYLSKQAYAFAKALIRQIEVCEYKPSDFEKKFVINLGEIDGEQFVVNGRIDRIDKSSNSVRIIDYKTGEDKVSISKLYEGRQLQLPIYILSMENFCKVDGAFYFPVFASISNKDNKLNGYFEENTSVIKKLDKTLSPNKLKSDVISLSLTKSSTESDFKVRSKIGVLKEGNLSKITDYARKLVASGVKESLSGNIKALPNETKFCEICPYYELCMFNLEFGKSRETVSSVKEENIVEIVERI